MNSKLITPKETFHQMTLRHAREMAKLQSNCAHTKTTIITAEELELMDSELVPHHSQPKFKICTHCNQVLGLDFKSSKKPIKKSNVKERDVRFEIVDARANKPIKRNIKDKQKAISTIKKLLSRKDRKYVDLELYKSWKDEYSLKQGETINVYQAKPKTFYVTVECMDSQDNFTKKVSAVDEKEAREIARNGLNSSQSAGFARSARSR